MLGYWVIEGRYILDFITWVTLTTNDQHYPTRIKAMFLLALSSKAEVKNLCESHPQGTLKKKEGNEHQLPEQTNKAL